MSQGKRAYRSPSQIIRAWRSKSRPRSAITPLGKDSLARAMCDSSKHGGTHPATPRPCPYHLRRATETLALLEMEIGDGR